MKSIKDLLNLSSNVTGSVTGSTIGFLLGGPPGAIAGAAIGPVVADTLKKIGNEIANRYLSQREQKRVADVIFYSAKKIDENFKNGLKFRDDGFLTTRVDERTAGDEITEGVLLSAQREYEEKKIPFQGNLLANIVFSPAISKAHANQLIKLSEHLSYRQLCVLSLFKQKENFNLRKQDYRSSGTVSGLDKISLLQEIFEMYSQGMLNASPDALLIAPDINPSKINVQGNGEILYQLMKLSEIDIQDLNEIAKILQ